MVQGVIVENIFKNKFIQNGESYETLATRLNTGRGMAHRWINQPWMMSRVKAREVASEVGLDQAQAIECWKYFKVMKYQEKL
jgi:hypothetical protein